MRRAMDATTVASMRRILERIEHDAAADARPCPICCSYLLVTSDETETFFVHFDDCELGTALERAKVRRRRNA